MIRGVVITANRTVSVREFEPVIDGLQEAVGGWIEVVHPRGIHPPLCMIVDDEGLLKDKPINHIASIWYGYPIVGDVVICKEGWTPEGNDLVDMGHDTAENICNQILKTFAGTSRVQNERSKEQ